MMEQRREPTMPPKRRKFDSRFPAARIKKIMQLDDDVGRVATPVPIVISRAVEIFLQAILTRSSDYASSRNAKTLTVGHLKYCIENEKQWDFLKDLTAKVPDVSACNENEELPKRGRKRKGSASKSSSSSVVATVRKKTKKDEEEERDESDQDEESDDSSSPASEQSSNSKQSTESSPLAILHRKLSTTVPSPLSVPTTSQSPLTALAAKLAPTSSGGLVPKPSGLIPVPNSQTSPLLAYASSLPQSSTQAPPLMTTPLSLQTTSLNITGSHGNSDDEDYDA